MVVLLFLLSLAAPEVRQTQAASLEYVVGTQDKLSITVVDEKDLTRVVTVGSDGGFDYPFIGHVKAAGQTVRAIQQDITARLKEKYLRNPQVAIEVEAYRSQVVYVWGQVKAPGSVTLSGNITLTEALARAGSPTADAGAYIEINRRARAVGGDSQAPKPQAERISMVELQSGRAQDILLSDGDTVFVPKAETFFVTGFVRNGGPFLHEVGMTVSKAVSMAGGITEKGSRSRIRITRAVDGRQVVLRDVKLEDLVQPGDSIEVLPRLW